MLRGKGEQRWEKRESNLNLEGQSVGVIAVVMRIHQHMLQNRLKKAQQGFKMCSSVHINGTITF